MSMSGDIAMLRSAQEFKSYQPEAAEPTPEDIAAAQHDERAKFDTLNDEIDKKLGTSGDDDLALEDPAQRQATPEQRFAEGRAAVKAAAERAAAAKAPKREADGTFASAETDDSLELPASPATESNETDDALRTLEYERALYRSGFDKDQIAAMKQNGSFETKGLARVTALKADDEAHSFFRTHRNADSPNGKTENQNGQPSQAPALEPLDVEPLVKPLAAELGLTESGASTLKQSFEQLAEVLTKRAEKQIEQGLGRVSEAQAAQAGQQVFVDAQVEVGKRIPELLDPTKFGKALKFAASLIKDAKEDPDHPVNEQLSRFATPREKAAHLLETYANVSGFKAKPSGEVVQSRGEKILRDNARSTVGDRTRTAPLTEREVDIYAFNDSMAKQGL